MADFNVRGVIQPHTPSSFIPVLREALSVTFGLKKFQVAYERCYLPICLHGQFVGMRVAMIIYGAHFRMQLMWTTLSGVMAPRSRVENGVPE